jgi:hypothetical protein
MSLQGSYQTKLREQEEEAVKRLENIEKKLKNGEELLKKRTAERAEMAHKLV